MDTRYAAILPRPLGVVETDPLPIASNNAFAWRLFVSYFGGGVYKGLDDCTLYVTFKSALTMVDADAEIAAGDGDGVFSVVDALRGVLDMAIPGAAIAADLTVGVVYYVDVTVVDGSGERYTILYDTVRPYQVVSKGA